MDREEIRHEDLVGRVAKMLLNIKEHQAINTHVFYQFGHTAGELDVMGRDGCRVTYYECKGRDNPKARHRALEQIHRWAAVQPDPDPKAYYVTQDKKHRIKFERVI